jgi:hypothetical protein
MMIHLESIYFALARSPLLMAGVGANPYFTVTACLKPMSCPSTHRGPVAYWKATAWAARTWSRRRRLGLWETLAATDLPWLGSTCLDIKDDFYGLGFTTSHVCIRIVQPIYDWDVCFFSKDNIWGLIESSLCLWKGEDCLFCWWFTMIYQCIYWRSKLLIIIITIIIYYDLPMIYYVLS